MLYSCMAAVTCDCERSVIMASVALAAWVEYASILVYSGLH